MLIELLSSIDEVVWESTADGTRMLFLSAAAERVYGRPAEDLIANPDLWLEVVHPDDRERVRRESARLGEGASSVALEYRIVLPDGTVRWIADRKFARRDAQGRVVRLGGTAADITSTKHAEVLLRRQHDQLERDFAARTRELRRAERKYRSLFEHAGDSMYSIQPSGVVVMLNAAWERITGYSREAWLGKPFAPLVHPDDLPLTVRHFEGALAGQVQVYEGRYRAADGSYRLAEHTLAPQVDADGEVTEIVGIARDITERREAEHRQQQLERQLLQTQKLESLGVLAGGIAHDFNNLLIGVLGEADLALADLAEDAALRRPLTTIRTTAERLSEMAKQMLAYSGKGRFAVASVDLSAVVEETVQLLGFSLSKKVSLACQLADGPLLLEADTSQLQQVVLNLITNAAESLGQAGGRVRIRTRAARLERATLPAGWCGEPLEAGRYVVLEVSDAGGGISPEARQRIFDPFFSSKGPGRGLGLAVVLGAVRGHAGAIEVESAPGGGTTFRALFPAAEPPTRSAEPEALSPGDRDPPADGRVVLVVDDERVARSLARRTLEKAGYAVLCCVDGQEALELLESREVDVVILDLTMPRLDGPDTFRELRRRWPGLPVIVSSGHDRRKIPAEMQRSCTFLAKPYRVARLTDAVAQALRDAGRRATS